MIINDTNLDLVFKGFQTIYSDALLAAREDAMKIAMDVPGRAVRGDPRTARPDA